MMNKEDLVALYLELHRLYKDTDKIGLLAEAEKLLFDGKEQEAETLLKQLPTKDQLLANLLETLKGKSVADTLKKVLNGKCKNLYEGLKGMASLMTHLCIELEKGRMEYRDLLEEVYGTFGKHYYGK